MFVEVTSAFFTWCAPTKWYYGEQQNKAKKNVSEEHNARPIVSSMIWHASEMSIVVTSRETETNRHEVESIFWCFGGQN